MNNFMLKIVAIFMVQAPMLSAVVPIQAPIDTTIPLRVKLYGIAEDKEFMLDAQEKPEFFKTLEGNTIVPDWPSWKYISKARQKELGCVLLGYQDRDVDDVKKAGWHLYDATNNMLVEPPSAPAAIPAKEGPAAPAPGAKPAAPAAIPANQGPAPAAAQAAPAPVAPKAKPKPEPAKKAPVVYVPKPGDTKQLLLELNVVCTNIPGITLTHDQIEENLPGGKVYGTPIDLIHHKNCVFIAKKYKADAPQPEIREWLDKMYFAILGPGGALDPLIK